MAKKKKNIPIVGEYDKMDKFMNQVRLYWYKEGVRDGREFSDLSTKYLVASCKEVLQSEAKEKK